MEIIDNPWSVAKNRAKQAGQILAREIAKQNLPISLIGYSLGCQVIVHLLKALKEMGALGKIYNIYFMGGAVSAKREIFNSITDLVAGRVFNIYSENDLILRYLYRTAEFGGLPIGLKPLNANGIVNIDASSFVKGHLQYSKCIRRRIELCNSTK